MKVKVYIKNILVPFAKEELNMAQFDYFCLLNDFRDSAIGQIKGIEKLCAKLTNTNKAFIIKFFDDFEPSVLNDPEDFYNRLEDLVAFTAGKKSNDQLVRAEEFNEIKELLNFEKNQFVQTLKHFQIKYQS